MKTRDEKVAQKIKVALAVIAISFLASCPEGRGEEAAAESTAAQLEAVNVMNNGSAQLSANQNKENKKQKFMEWLEQHPRLEQKIDANGDGKLEPAELKRAREKMKSRKQGKDFENNSSSSVSGQEANGENISGSEGGATASSAVKSFSPDLDNNPPGPQGGKGTNWENRPGPQGGPGASPNYRSGSYRDRDNNPPGPRGGKGTNWENRPGPQGGPGASPDRRRNR